MTGVHSTTPFHTRIAVIIVASKCCTLHYCVCINNTTEANENNEKMHLVKLVSIDVTSFLLPSISLANYVKWHSNGSLLVEMYFPQVGC